MAAYDERHSSANLKWVSALGADHCVTASVQIVAARSAATLVPATLADLAFPFPAEVADGHGT
jgi:hypothetical protein